MPDLGRKYTCYSCHTKFYDLGKPVPLCPKCGADQRDAEDAPVASSPRGRRVVEPPPVEEPEFEPEAEVEVGGDDEEEDIIQPAGADREEVEEDEEEEEF
jgi:hypothetical protein